MDLQIKGTGGRGRHSKRLLSSSASKEVRIIRCKWERGRSLQYSKCTEQLRVCDVTLGNEMLMLDKKMLVHTACVCICIRADACICMQMGRFLAYL